MIYDTRGQQGDPLFSGLVLDAVMSLHSSQSISTADLESGSRISDQKRGRGCFDVRGNTSPGCPGGEVEKRLTCVVWRGRTRAVRVCMRDFYGPYTRGELRLVGFEP